MVLFNNQMYKKSAPLESRGAFFWRPVVATCPFLLGKDA